MAISLNDNLKINAPKPADDRYLNVSTPYTNTSDACTAIPVGRRYIGLTVFIDTKEYRWKDGTADEDLVEKTAGGVFIWDITDPFSTFYTVNNLANVDGIKKVICRGNTDIATMDIFFIDAGLYDMSGIEFIGDSSHYDGTFGIYGTIIAVAEGAIMNRLPNLSAILMIFQDTVCDNTISWRTTLSNGSYVISAGTEFGGTGNPAVVLTNDDNNMEIYLKDNSLILSAFGVYFCEHQSTSQIVLYLCSGSEVAEDSFNATTLGYMRVHKCSDSIFKDQTDYISGGGSIDISLVSKSESTKFTALLSNLTSTNVRDAIEELWGLISTGSYIRSNTQTLDAFILANGLNVLRNEPIDVYMYDAAGTTIRDGFVNYGNAVNISQIRLHRISKDNRAMVRLTHPYGANNFFNDLDGVDVQMHNPTIGYCTNIIGPFYRKRTDAGFYNGELGTASGSIFGYNSSASALHFSGNYFFSSSVTAVVPLVTLPNTNQDSEFEVNEGYIDSDTIAGGNGTSTGVSIGVIQNYVPKTYQISFKNTPTLGYYTLTYNGTTSSQIPYNAGTTEVSNACTEIGLIGVTVMLVSGNIQILLHGYDFTTVITADDYTDGLLQCNMIASGQRQIVNLVPMFPVTGGTWDLSYSGGTPVTLARDASNGDILTGAITASGNASVLVTGGLNNSLSIENVGVYSEDVNWSVDPSLTCASSILYLKSNKISTGILNTTQTNYLGTVVFEANGKGRNVSNLLIVFPTDPMLKAPEHLGQIAKWNDGGIERMFIGIGTNIGDRLEIQVIHTEEE